MQNDSITLAGSVSIWKDLLRSKTLDMYHEELYRQYQQAVTEVHMLAYLTDMKYFGKTSLTELVNI